MGQEKLRRKAVDVWHQRAFERKDKINTHSTPAIQKAKTEAKKRWMPLMFKKLD